MIESIEEAALEVLVAHESGAIPIDPFSIARLEGIRLAAGDYDGCFDSRLEYRRRDGQGMFYLLYAEENPPDRPEGRVRFSIAHELGHFFLPEHRKYVLSGVWHGSHTGFVSTSQTEREADLFAAAFLMPRNLFVNHVQTKCDGRCTMRDLEALAQAFRTSLTSTAMRYVQLGFEACAMVVSDRESVRFAISSEAMREQGLGWVAPRSRIPNQSVTRGLMDAEARGAGSREGEVDSGIWFPQRRSRPIWEECRTLGRTGLVLTFLAVNEHRDEDAEED